MLAPKKPEEDEKLNDMVDVLREHGDLVVNKSAETIVWLKVEKPPERLFADTPEEDTYVPYPVDTRFVAFSIVDNVVDLEFSYFQWDEARWGIGGDVQDVKTPQLFGQAASSEGPDWQPVAESSSYATFESHVLDFLHRYVAAFQGGMPRGPQMRPNQLEDRTRVGLRREEIVEEADGSLSNDEINLQLYDEFRELHEPWYDELTFQWHSLMPAGSRNIDWLNGVIKVVLELPDEERQLRTAFAMQTAETRLPSLMPIRLNAGPKQPGWRSRGILRACRLLMNLPLHTAMQLKIVTKRGTKRGR